MTIDARNSVWTANSNIRNKNLPQGIVSSRAEVNRRGYGERLFFCPEMHVQSTGADPSTKLPRRRSGQVRTSEGVCRPQFSNSDKAYCRQCESRFLSGRGNLSLLLSDEGIPQIGRPLESRFATVEIEGKTSRLGAKFVEKLCKWLALTAEIYYNNPLNIVGPRLMQGVAKLRKVAEVVRTYFVYLTLPHIAYSKGTSVAK